MNRCRSPNALDIGRLACLRRHGPARCGPLPASLDCSPNDRTMTFSGHCPAYGRAVPRRLDPEPGPDRDRCEAELLAVGHPLPLPHRSAWAEFRRPAGSWFVAVRDAADTCPAGFALEVGRSRSLPGHSILGWNGWAQPAGRPHPHYCAWPQSSDWRIQRRVLRLHVEVFSPDADTRYGTGKTSGDRGFRPVRKLGDTHAPGPRPAAIGRGATPGPRREHPSEGAA